MQHLRMVAAQCLIATSLLGAESLVNTVKLQKEIATIAAHSDEDAIVYNSDAKSVPKLTRRSKGSYEVVYDGRMVIPLWAKERFPTTVTLPTEEQILRVVAADSANWEIIFINNSNQFYVKPRFPNSSTSINVITKSGNHYVFFATSNIANKNHEPALMLDVLPPAWMQFGTNNAGTKGGSQSNTLGGGQESDISLEECERRCQAARQAGLNQAAIKHEDDLRDYATSIFHKANLDYKWGGNTKQLRLKRVFDDGRVTYLVFESSLNIQPAFWEIDGGSRKDVTVQRSVFSPEVMIVGKLFKDGVLSIGKGLKIKIRNRGWSLATKKAETNTQLRGDNPSANNEKEVSCERLPSG